MLPLYFASVNGNRAGASGVILLFLTVPTLVLPSVGGWLTKYLSIRAILVLSPAFTAIGAAGLTFVRTAARFLTTL